MYTFIDESHQDKQGGSWTSMLPFQLSVVAMDQWRTRLMFCWESWIHRQGCRVHLAGLSKQLEVVNAKSISYDKPIKNPLTQQQ
jgi:hypothetical protein